MDKSSWKLVKNEQSGLKTGAGTWGCIQRPRSNWQWVISHIQTWQESKAHKKGHQNTFLTIFMCFQLFLCLHALLPTFNRFRAPARIPECQHMFSSLTAHFQLIFNYFQLFLAVFFFLYFIHFHLFSIDFIHFRSSLFVFDYFYPNSSVTACFHLFF